MLPLTLQDLAEMFAAVESKDLLVKRVRLNSETLRGLKKDFAKVGQKLGKRVWKAKLQGSHGVHPPHIYLEADDGVETLFCIEHEKDGQLCTECSTREVMES